MTLVECSALTSLAPSGRWCSVGGAKGIRTPDLLVANETRYQLRHSPADRPGRSARRLYHRWEPGPCLGKYRQAVGPGRGRGPADYADAAFAASSPVASGTSSAEVSGASAVTGTWGRAEAVAPAPDRSMVRTVRGASGFDT